MSLSKKKVSIIKTETLTGSGSTLITSTLSILTPSVGFVI